MPHVQSWDGFKPPGRPLPGDWDPTAIAKSCGEKRVVHLVIWDGDQLLFVKNTSKIAKGFTKPAAWGIPTETVRTDPAESPYEAAERVIREEVNLFGGEILVNSHPILVTKTANGVVHFLFEGSIEPYTDVPSKIRDTAEEVEEAKLCNPSIIHIPEPREEIPDKDKMPFFTRDGQKELVYASHIGFAAFSRFRR